jgi:hypothetical protein
VSDPGSHPPLEPLEAVRRLSGSVSHLTLGILDLIERSKLPEDSEVRRGLLHLVQSVPPEKAPTRPEAGLAQSETCTCIYHVGMMAVVAVMTRSQCEYLNGTCLD